MKEENSIPHTSPFEAIRKVDEKGREYWSARSEQASRVYPI